MTYSRRAAAASTSATPVKPMAFSSRFRPAVRRNPSRLYRVVKPLANISACPSPATKRCIGPEFIVMSENSPAVVVDLSSGVGVSGVVTKQISVVMLNGQRITVHCNPATITSGEVLDSVLSHQDIKETANFALALRAAQENDEYWILSAPDTKLSKVAPIGWRPQAGLRCSVDSFTLYLRFKHLPGSVDAFRDPNNKHLLYLQLRRDVSEGRFHMNPSRHLTLAAMALQTEFGDYSEDIHGSEGDYFLLEHYLPYHAISKIGEESARASLTKLHRAHLGQSQSKTELRYCREIQRMDNYGFHNFAVSETKKPSNSNPSSVSRHGHRRHLGIHMQGVFLFETSRDRSVPHKIISSFFWGSIGRIQYDKTRFQLSVREEGGGGGGERKAKFYMSEVKSKVMFDLASAHHKFYMQQRWANNGGNSPNNANAEDDNRVEYRTPKEKAIRSLKNRLLSKNKLSQQKLFTSSKAVASSSSSSSSSSMRRSTTVSNAKLLVKRLTHYSSMADAVVDGAGTKTMGGELNESNKENQTPNTRQQSYR